VGAAAVIVAAMNTDSIPLSKIATSQEAGLFLQAVQGVLAIFKNVFLPHLGIGFAIYALVTYVTYHYLIAPVKMTPFLAFFCVLCIMIFYGGITLFLSVLGACLFSLRKACVAWEEFLEGLLDRVKETALSKIENLNDGITKEQAKIVIRGSVRETIASLRPQSFSTVGNWAVAFVLGCLILAMRSVLVAKVVKYSGRTIKMTKLFAGRATLVGAIFLNLRFFSTVLLLSLYVGSAALLLLNFLIIKGLA